MTREEALYWLDTIPTKGEQVDALEMAIKALEQEPNDIDLDNISFLIDYCSKNIELYNEVANHLHERFHIISAELCLLVTYYIAEERRKGAKNENIC